MSAEQSRSRMGVPIRGWSKARRAAGRTKMERRSRDWRRISALMGLAVDGSGTLGRSNVSLNVHLVRLAVNILHVVVGCGKQNTWRYPGSSLLANFWQAGHGFAVHLKDLRALDLNAFDEMEALSALNLLQIGRRKVAQRSDTFLSSANTSCFGRGRTNDCMYRSCAFPCNCVVLLCKMRQ
jgi:hypothetical protein